MKMNSDSILNGSRFNGASGDATAIVWQRLEVNTGGNGKYAITVRKDHALMVAYPCRSLQLNMADPEVQRAACLRSTLWISSVTGTDRRSGGVRMMSPMAAGWKKV